MGARILAPQRLTGALTRYFPVSNGLTTGLTGSARQTIPAMQLQQAVIFRGCSHLFMFKLPYSLGPQVAPTDETYRFMAAGPFTPRIEHAVTQHELWHRYVSDTSN